jgi:phospholipid/cholesterol/gamma-HCH transport system substrate-binding protein
LGERVPSQKQLKWSQLKVGITVVAASITLAVLIFLMSNTGGVFTRKIILRSYFDNAAGLRQGAPVRLDGVDIGNVVSIRVVADPLRKRTPVEVRMSVTTRYISSIHRDSITALSTAGVLGETYIDIESAQAQGPPVQDGDELAAESVPDFEDVVKASQGTLQNLDALEKRVDRILAFIESGNGSVGKLIYDPALYNNLAATVSEFQGLVNDVTNGKGSLGKLVATDELYSKVNVTVDKLNGMIDDLNAGKGTAGKFLKDEALYKNANDTIANIKQLTDDINAGKGALGTLAKDPQFANKLQNTMNKISELTNQLAAGQGTMGKLLQDPALYNNANQMLIETRELVKSIREDPKKYLTIRFKVF